MGFDNVQNIQIFGAGGHAKVVIQTARAAGYVPVAVFDDNIETHGKMLCGVPIVGHLSEALKSMPTVIAIGNNQVRKRCCESMSLPWVTIIHPTAVVDPTATIGEGTVVFAGAVIQADSIIGRHAIINTSASVDHDSCLSDYVHVAPGCRVTGEVHVGEGVLLGAGTSIKPRMKIGEWSVVGAGGVVVADIPSHVTAMGVPARVKP